MRCVNFLSRESVPERSCSELRGFGSKHRRCAHLARFAPRPTQSPRFASHQSPRSVPCRGGRMGEGVEGGSWWARPVGPDSLAAPDVSCRDLAAGGCARSHASHTSRLSRSPSAPRTTKGEPPPHGPAKLHHCTKGQTVARPISSLLAGRKSDDQDVAAIGVSPPLHQGRCCTLPHTACTSHCVSCRRCPMRTSTHTSTHTSARTSTRTSTRASTRISTRTPAHKRSATRSPMLARQPQPHGRFPMRGARRPPRSPPPLRRPRAPQSPPSSMCLPRRGRSDPPKYPPAQPPPRALRPRWSRPPRCIAAPFRVEPPSPDTHSPSWSLACECGAFVCGVPIKFLPRVLTPPPFGGYPFWQ